MIKWALRAINKAERDWNYDASYMRDIIDASPRDTWLFSCVTALGQFRRYAPGLGSHCGGHVSQTQAQGGFQRA